MSEFKELCLELENSIRASYETGVSMDEAEKLASKFLYAQMQVSNELRKSDLDSRTRKSGLKAVRAAVYLEIIQTSEKKPTEAGIGAMIDVHEIVQSEQTAFDLSEVERDDLKRYFDIFSQAHVHFRTIAKGSFGG